MANTLTLTTLSAAVGINQLTIPVASASNIVAPINNVFQQIYVINPESLRGELMNVTAVSGTQISVARISLFRQAFVSGAIVVIGFSPASNFQLSFFEQDPVGAVTAAQVPAVPYLNATNGNQWLRSVDGLWVPGFGNPQPNKGVTTAVASTAGPVTPSGPLFHITGNSAITGFTRPVGFAGGSFSVIPDGTFTWTTGDGSIGLAGTAVVGRVITFTYDSNAGQYFPSYV